MLKGQSGSSRPLHPLLVLLLELQDAPSRSAMNFRCTHPVAQRREIRAQDELAVKTARVETVSSATSSKEIRSSSRGRMASPSLVSTPSRSPQGTVKPRSVPARLGRGCRPPTT